MRPIWGRDLKKTTDNVFSSQVCKTDGTNDDIPVLISGSTESIAAAKKMIEELIEEANMYRRPTTSRHDGNYRFVPH